MKLFFSFLFLLFIFSSCGGNNTTTSSSGSTFSGTISSTGTTVGSDPRLNPHDLNVGPKILSRNTNGLRIPSTSVAGKTMNCHKADKTSTTATIGTNGEFNVSITAGTPLKCNILDGTTDLGTFVISSSTEKDMKGNGKTVDEFIPSGSINAGTVTFDPYSAKVTMTDTALGSAIASATIDNPWDFTGTYLASAYTGTVPTGYNASLCTSQQQQQQGNNCDGPAVGETFYIKKISGFEVDGSGNTTSTPRYGIMVWQSSAAFAACGNKLGFTYATGKTNAKVDLTNSGVSEGAPDWTVTITVASALKGWDNSTDVLTAGPAGVTDGWKIQTARNSYAIQACKTVSVGTGSSAVPGWECTDTGNKISVSLGGGCLDSSGNPVNVTNWSGLTCTQSNVSITGDARTFIKYTCTGTFNSSNVTCTNTNYQETGFSWNNVSTIAAAGALCSAINTATDSGALAQLNCYSNAYWRYVDEVLRGSGGSASTCFRDLRTDWTATTAADFIVNTGPAKPVSQYILEGFDYTSNESGSFRNEEQDIRGIQVTSGSSTIWINCRTLKIFTMALKRISTSPDVLLAEMVSQTRLTDTKASCWTSDARTQLGNLDADGKAVSKTLFNMTKQ